MDTESKKLTLSEFRKLFATGQISARDVVKDCLNEISGRDFEVGAFLDEYRDEALKQAEEADADRAAGKPLGSLAGVPIAIKDNILIEGKTTTAGSKILKDYVATYDATVIRKLRERGAIFVGKTNLDEFAMGSSTENSAFKLTRNPHDLSRVPGGSSGGSAAAVAADMALASLGSDTGGSIRQPASLCGVVGLKPTYGAVSRYGIIALASSLDQIGPFAKTVEDAALIFDAIKGQDPKDATSFDPPYGEDLLNPDFSKIKNMTVGLPEEYFGEGLDREVGDAVQAVIGELKSKGIKFKKISLPHTKYALSVYYIILPAEVSTNLARLDGIRYGTRGKSKKLIDLYYEDKGEGFGPETKRRIILGTYVLSAGHYDAHYGKAQKVRRLISDDFTKAFDRNAGGVDVILTPVAPTAAFKIGEKAANPLQMYLSDIYTIPVNLAGLPGISIPVKGREGKLPIGFQLIGRKWHEADILGMGRLYEEF